MEKLSFDFLLNEDKELVSRMEKIVFNSPEARKYFKENKISDEAVIKNIYNVYDFVCDLNYCKNCPGIKNCAKENPLLVSGLLCTGDIIENQLKPCDKIMQRVSFEKQYVIRDFDDSWLDKSTKDINKTAAKREAINLYASFIKGLETPWIYLTGGAGCGRSFFAAMLTNDAANRSLGPIYFLNSAKRIKALGDLSMKKGDEFNKELDKYCNARILVFDDFGNEFVNDMIRDTVIYPIISARSNKNLLTIFTSDFKISEIETLYSTSKAGQLKAQQICRVIKASAKKEIDLGSLAIY